jgi:hypothetical protein
MSTVENPDKQSREGRGITPLPWIVHPRTAAIRSLGTCGFGQDRATAANLVAALNAASALLDKIEDNPTLFFGMEDTCQDEFDDLRRAIEGLGGSSAAPEAGSDAWLKLSANFHPGDIA